MEEIKVPILRDNKKLTVSQMMEYVTNEYPDGIPHGLRIRFIGEPSFNSNTTMFLIRMAQFGVYPIIETILPSQSDEWRFPYVNEAINVINEEYGGTRGILKFLIGSTSEKARKTLYGAVRTMADFSKAVPHFPKLKNDAKIVLSFDTSHPVDADKILKCFSPSDFAVELKTDSTTLNLGYKDTEAAVKKAGFEIYYEDDEGSD